MLENGCLKVIGMCLTFQKLSSSKYLTINLEFSRGNPTLVPQSAVSHKIRTHYFYWRILLYSKNGDAKTRAKYIKNGPIYEGFK